MLGHYIVVCGFDREKQLIYYKDPAVKSGNDSVTKSDYSIVKFEAIYF